MLTDRPPPTLLPPTRVCRVNPATTGAMADDTVPVRDRLWMLAAGLLLVTMPAVTLAVAYAVLLATQSAVANRLTPLELMELYLIELAAFAVFGYLLYRLTQYVVHRQVRDVTETDVSGTDGVETLAQGRR